MINTDSIRMSGVYGATSGIEYFGRSDVGGYLVSWRAPHIELLDDVEKQLKL